MSFYGSQGMISPPGAPKRKPRSLYLDLFLRGTSPKGACKGQGNTPKMPCDFPEASTAATMPPKPAAHEACGSVFKQFWVDFGTGSCNFHNFSARATRLAATRAKRCSMWPGPHGTGFGENTVHAKKIRNHPKHTSQVCLAQKICFFGSPKRC